LTDPPGWNSEARLIDLILLRPSQSEAEDGEMPIQAAQVSAPNPGRVYMSGQWEIDLGQRELRAQGTLVPIGNRAFEIISALVQSAGKLVSKDDLMGRVWGAIVEENTIQVHISAIRKALGPDRGMLKTTSGRGYRLLGSWTVRQEEHVSVEPVYFEQARKPVRPFQTNLPSRTSDLIGRDGAVQHLRNLLSAYRTVTLTGPGGIGKTSLALEVARNLFPAFQGDVWLVELVSLSDPDLVPSAVAGVLGLGGEKMSAKSVARAIGGKKLLLVLDNCEHVVDAVASLAETVVRLCPATSVLATSREVLRIEGEHVYRVPALDVPRKHQEESRIVLEHSAVQLFIARTTAWRSDFSADGDSLTAISAICRHLDGIPLAIEFAAARAATLGPQQVASRLDDRLSLLAGGRRTALPRHQTLRATLDWSYELLPDSERCLLRHLAVFPAGFTLEAATAVVGDASSAGSTVVEGIANLVAKSLITLDGSTLSSRWRLLETIRAYALEKLAKSGEAEQAARRLAEFFRDLVAPSCSSGSQPSIENLARHGREIDNVRAALDWSFSSMGDPAIGVMLTAAYVPVWMHLSLMEECRRRIERALSAVASQANPDVRHEMQLLSALGSAQMLTRGTGPDTTAALTKALALAECLDDADYRLRALWGLYVDHLTRGYYQAALAFAERFRWHAITMADPADLLIGDRMIGSALHVLGNQIDARRHIERMLDRYVAPIDRSDKIRFQFDQRIVARCFHSRILWLQGFADQAMQIAASTVEDALAIDHPVSVFLALFQTACPVAVLTGDLPAADGFVRMLHDLSVKHGMDSWSVVGRCFRGVLLIRCGDIAAGLELLRTALASMPETAFHLHYVQFLAELAQALAHTGQVAKGLLTIEDALARCERNGEGWYVAELMRVKGELLLLDSGDRSIVTADQYFSQAIEVARRQGALMWELRNATSLAGLKVKQGRGDEARQILGPVYDRFTEDFETTDLRAAKALLESLQSHHVGSER
jgi:predicted ATPase/DNA-binding winged helix-turn-helix (wHTH) protein